MFLNQQGMSKQSRKTQGKEQDNMARQRMREEENIQNGKTK